MRILIAEDDITSRLILNTTLSNWGYDVEVVTDGAEARRILESPSRPPLAILDWMMPELDGVSVCRELTVPAEERPYLIVLTSRNRKADITEALKAGADDYLSKPFEPGELHARVMTGIRVVELRALLQARTRELAAAKGELAAIRSELAAAKSKLDSLQR